MAKEEIQNVIEVGEYDNKSYIKVKGSGNFKNSSFLKDYILLMMKREYSDFVIDLEFCTSMDSTFMGVIAGIAVILKDTHNKTLTLININNHNFDLLSTLGIDQFINIERPEKDEEIELESLSQKKVAKKKLAKNMLDAHATLMSISEENRIKFQDVYEFLQKEVENN